MLRFIVFTLPQLRSPRTLPIGAIIWYNDLLGLPISYRGISPHNNPARAGRTQNGEPELARLLVFQRRFLRLQFSVCQESLRWSANPVTSVVRQQR